MRQAVAHTGVKFVEQKPQKGTGHALMVARDALSAYDQVIVLYGDAPLITPATITRLRDFHAAKRAAMTILTGRLQDPTGYGRVLRKRSKSDEVKAIVEEKAATPAQKKIHEINSGTYAFAVAPLFRNIDKLSADNAHAEFYLTDMAAILRKAKERVVAVAAPDPNEVLGGNTRAELVDIDQHIRQAKCQQLMRDGATIFYPQTCVIDSDVEIGPDSVIEPFVQILGNSRVGSDCRIRSYSVIRNTVIDDGVMVLPGCVMDDSHVKSERGRRPLLAPAPRQRNRRKRPRRQFCRDQENPPRQGLQGQSSQLSGQCRNRRRRERGSRDHHLQLRWRAQAHDRNRRRRVRWQ